MRSSVTAILDHQNVYVRPVLMLRLCHQWSLEAETACCCTRSLQHGIFSGKALYTLLLPKLCSFPSCRPGAANSTTLKVSMRRSMGSVSRHAAALCDTCLAVPRCAHAARMARHTAALVAHSLECSLSHEPRLIWWVP